MFNALTAAAPALVLPSTVFAAPAPGIRVDAMFNTDSVRVAIPSFFHLWNPSSPLSWASKSKPTIPAAAVATTL